MRNLPGFCLKRSPFKYFINLIAQSLVVITINYSVRTGTFCRHDCGLTRRSRDSLQNSLKNQYMANINLSVVRRIACGIIVSGLCLDLRFSLLSV